jgi:hypothetical protein
MEVEMRMKQSVATVAVLAGLAGAISADVTVKSTIENQGVGGFMNMQGTQQVTVSGDKAKTMTQMKMTNKVVKFLGGGKPQENAEITRIDKELFWNLDLKEKEYTELTFADMKAQFEKGLQKAREEKAKEPGKSDSIQMQTEIKVEATGKSQTLIGHKADEVLITMVFKGEDSATGKSGGMKLEMDLWLAKDVPGYQEYQKYQQTLAEKLGFVGHSHGSMEDALKGFGVDPKVIYEKMKGIEGVPLLSVVSIIPEGIDSLPTKTADTTKPEAEATAAEPAPQDAKGTALKKLGGLFGKKKKDSKEQAAAKENKEPGPLYLFHIINTVTEVSTSSVVASEFDIPQGFKKKSK